MQDLGKKVNFIRQKPNGEFHEGEGILVAYAVDPRRRLTGHIQILDADGKPEGINVEMAAINPSDEFKVKFREAMGRVQKLEATAKKKNLEIVAKYNPMIDRVYNEAFGPQVVMDTLTPVEEAGDIEDLTDDPEFLAQKAEGNA